MSARKSSEPNLVAIDTMVLIWGVRQHGPADQVKRVEWLYESLENENARVIVPAVAVAEFLVPLSERERPLYLSKLRENYAIAPFDAICVETAAKLFGVRMASHREKRTRSTGDRNVVKNDALIVASAFHAGATRFYSHDVECRKLAESVGMTASDLPTMGNSLYRQ